MKKGSPQPHKRVARTQKFTTVADPVVAATARTFRFVFSDSGTDRDGDRLNAAGWDTREFEANPIVLFQHDANSPIGKASDLRIADNKLTGNITFAETELADTIYQLVAGGFLKAVSVGFSPIDYTFADDPDRRGGVDYHAQKLLEVSIVSIPANPRALIEAQFRGIDVAPVVKWLETKAADRKTPASVRAIYKVCLNTTKDGMGESSPSAGGFVVGNCGRDETEECGLKCEVHRDDEVEEKTIMAIAKALKEARLEIERLNKLAAKRTKADEPAGDDEVTDKDEGNDSDVLLDKCLTHIKCHKELSEAADDHREEAVKCLKALHKAFRMKDEEPDGDEEVEDKDVTDGDEEEKRFHQIMARARAAGR
jgi:HK97 family phage prohead protease